MGWSQVALIGHSLGSGVAILTAGAFSERITQLALIDGIGPPFTTAPDGAVEHLHRAVRHRFLFNNLNSRDSENALQPEFFSYQEAIQARIQGIGGQLSPAAAEQLVERQLREVEGGYKWRYDPRLTVPPLFQMSEQQVQSFIHAISCRTCLFLGDQGLFSKGQKQARIDCFNALDKYILPGGHHLHLEDSALSIANILNTFLASSLQQSTSA